VIEEGIPLPASKRVPKRKPVLLDMKPGQSFQFKSKDYRAWTGAAQTYKTTGIKFVIRKVAPGVYRLWCVKT
jgi:hypothetical protein